MKNHITLHFSLTVSILHFLASQGFLSSWKRLFLCIHSPEKAIFSVSTLFDPAATLSTTGRGLYRGSKDFICGLNPHNTQRQNTHICTSLVQNLETVHKKITRRTLLTLCYVEALYLRHRKECTHSKRS